MKLETDFPADTYEVACHTCSRYLRGKVTKLASWGQMWFHVTLPCLLLFNVFQPSALNIYLMGVLPVNENGKQKIYCRVHIQLFLKKTLNVTRKSSSQNPLILIPKFN